MGERNSISKIEKFLHQVRNVSFHVFLLILRILRNRFSFLMTFQQLPFQFVTLFIDRRPNYDVEKENEAVSKFESKVFEVLEPKVVWSFQFLELHQRARRSLGLPRENRVEKDSVSRIFVIIFFLGVERKYVFELNSYVINRM